MSAKEQFDWEAPARRFMPRIMVSYHFSGVEPEYRNWVADDLKQAEAQIRVATRERHTDWDCVFTNRRIPETRLGMNATARERLERRSQVLRTNRSLANHSDCLIVHSFSNGSAMLGDIQRSFLVGPIVRPVVVLRKSSGISVAWEAMADQYPQFRIVDFDSSDLGSVRSCLDTIAKSIEESAVARQGIEATWRPLCDELTREIRGEPEDVRREIARVLGLNDASLHTLVTTPMELAALPQNKAALLLERYGEAVRRGLLRRSVQAFFSPHELEAYRAWASQQAPSRAQAVLEREVALRAEAAAVYNQRQRRITPQAWELLAGEFGE